VQFHRLAVFGTLVVVIAGTGLANHQFLSVVNLTTVASGAVPVALITMGMVFLLISGSFDLSVGYAVAFLSVVGTILINHLGSGGGIVAIVLIGMIIGAVNGLIVCGIGVNSLVTTLGTGYVLYGLASVIQGNTTPTLNHPWLTQAATASAGSIPVPVWVFIAFLFVGGYLSRTVLGRSIFAVGGNPEAARYNGIRVNYVRFVPFVFMGLLASIAALIEIGFIGGGMSTIASDWPLQAIAGAVVGGVSLAGGSGSVTAGVIGAALIAIVGDVLVFLNVNSTYEDVVVGVIIVIAVAVDVRLRRRFSSRVREFTTSVKAEVAEVAEVRDDGGEA
jgi:ribose/xylose/arabinose/galactoside ABC-type transport system permease subunit